MDRILRISAVVAAWSVLASCCLTALAELHRPVAIAVDCDSVWVAEGSTGRVFRVRESDQPYDFVQVGRQVSDMGAVPGAGLLVALDSSSNEVALLEVGDRPVVRHRCAAVGDPARVHVTTDGSRCYVTGRWSHEVQLFEIDKGAKRLAPRRHVRLPFAPREALHLCDQNKLVVAAAFGDQIAVLDAQTLELQHVHRCEATSIRGLVLSGDSADIYLACQEISQEATTSRQDIDFGRLINNLVRIWSVDDVLDSNARLSSLGRSLPLGGAGHGAADPSAIAVIDADRVAVTVGGTNELAIVDIPTGQTHTIAVGMNPVSVAYDEKQGQIYVANRLDDSVSVVAVGSNEAVSTIRLSTPGELSAAERGERLFHDGRLSRDGWMTCHTCHVDGHTNGRRVDTLGDGRYGAPKRVLTLLGTGLTDTWAWNGQIKELQHQVDRSVSTTMQGNRPTAEKIADLTAYLHSLKPPPALEPRTDASLELIERGRAVFVTQGCDNCHVPPLTYTRNGAVEVDMSDEHGATSFNPPSLRGVSQQSAFFHDNRAESLEAVFREHGHQLKNDLSDAELADLVRFLKSL